MGSKFTIFCNDLCKKKHIKALVLGLSGVGKTSFINRYKSRQIFDTGPTEGIKVETLQLKQARLTVWDVGRQQNLDKILMRYYGETSVVIYVVDSSDRKRIPKVKQQLDKLLKQGQLQNTALLVLANKKDLKDSMSVGEICEKLGLLDLKNRQWLIKGTSAITGEGVYECFGWLNEVTERQK